MNYCVVIMTRVDNGIGHVEVIGPVKSETARLIAQGFKDEPHKDVRAMALKEA